MQYQTFIQPVKRFGFEQWRAYATCNGTVVWECLRWSEAQAKTEATRAIARFTKGA